MMNAFNLANALYLLSCKRLSFLFHYDLSQRMGSSLYPLHATWVY